MAQVSLFALSVIQTSLAIFVWFARPSSVVHRRFAAQTLLLASWVLGIAGLQGGNRLDAWGSVAFASASLIPAAFLAFTSCYPTATPSVPSALLRAVSLAGASFALLALTTDLIAFDNQFTQSGLSRKPGPLYPLFAVYFLVTFIAALGVLIRKWRNARGLQRAQLQYLAVGITVSAAGGIGTNLLLPLVTGRSAYSWMGPYFSLCLVALTAHAIIRHRLMDLRLVIHRGLVYVLVAGLAWAALIVAGRQVVSRWHMDSVAVSLDLLVLALIVAVMASGSAQRLINRVIDPYLHRGRIDYASGIRQATRRLSQLMEPADLALELRSIMLEVLVPESFAMVISPPDGADLELLPAEPTATGLFRSPQILAALRAAAPSRSVLVTNRDTGAGLDAYQEALSAAGIEVAIPLRRRSQLLGLVLLGPRRSGDAYFTSDLAFAESIAEVASIALENALLYRQRIQMLEYSDRLLESLDSAVVAVDASGRVTSFNPAAQTLLGLAPSTGQTLDHLPSEVAWALAVAVRTTWRPHEIEATIEHPSRGGMPVILSTAVLHDPQKAVAGALAVITDLSRVKALERNQRRVEHLAMMARFYAGIAHEIRSPLASISNFIAMLPDRFDDPEYRDTAIRLLPTEVARIVRLADRLRLMAPSEGGQLGHISLQPLLTDIVAIHAAAATEAGASIECHCDDELPMIIGDPSQLVQLFVNLLRNAIEAMPDGGRVRIEARRASSRPDFDGVAVRIIDEGTGIDASIRPDIFEPFFTTKPSGTGLGLSICREIAEFHGAALTLTQRTDGSGTVAQVAFLTIPALPGESHYQFPALESARGTARP